jgi:hypothetical protein
LAPPRITAARFKQLLKSKNSPAVPESDAVYQYLVAHAVDPSFALAQFRVESQYGTSGFAVQTGSWGNMLFDPALTINNVGKVTKTTSDGFKYTYATYDTYLNAIKDYVRYIHHYIDIYELTTIYQATGRWLGLNRTGDPGHISYVTTVVNDMVEYEYPEGGYVSGDKMIFSGEAIDKATGRLRQRYPIVDGQTKLYKGTGDEFYLKTFDGTSGNAWFLGPINGFWPATGVAEWGAVLIGSTLADPKGTTLYIKNPVKSKVINV